MFGTLLATMTFFLPHAKGFHAIRFRPAIVDPKSTDDSDLGGFNVCHATRIFSLLKVSVTVKTWFVKTGLIDLLFSRPITLK